jgi:hypothetical protein
MKTGTIVSPWRYDAAARHALQSASLRRLAILRYASGARRSRLALDPKTLRHQTVHALLGGLHLADTAIHCHAGERVRIETRE